MAGTIKALQAAATARDQARTTAMRRPWGLCAAPLVVRSAMGG
jgi:hypothetical protein